jgi:DNA polymerase III psi subunit
MELKYDPTQLTFTKEKIQDLIFANNKDKYCSLVTKEETGEIKIMLSLTKDIEGITKANNNLIKLEGNMLKDILSKVEVKNIKVVSSDAVNINVPKVQEVNIWILTKR